VTPGSRRSEVGAGRVEAVSDGPELEPSVAELSYEQARDELVKVVGALEQGGVSLEESLALWERGEALAQRCEQWLIGAKARLDAARTTATGGAS